MTIYIDVVILENLIMNYIIMYATAIILKKKISIIRLFTSSMLGAIYAIISYIFQSPIYSIVILKILLSITMVYIAFKPIKIKELLKQLLIFYMTSFVFGGAALSLIYFIKPQEAQMKNGIFSGEYSLKVVFLGGIVGFTIIVIAFKSIKNKISSKDIFYDIEIYIENNKIETKAMIDTGNMLKEPITNTPVIVVEHTLLYNVIPKQILNNIDEILLGNLEIIEEKIREKYLSKLKFIPFSSIGKANGMLLGIKADKIIIKNEDETKEIDKIIIAIYNKSLTKRGEYRALLGINII